MGPNYTLRYPGIHNILKVWQLQDPELSLLLTKLNQVPVDALGATASSAESEIAVKIRQQLAVLKQKVTETATELDKCRTEQEQFSVEYYSCRENSNRLQALQQQHGDQNAQVKALKVNKETMEKSIKSKV